MPKTIERSAIGRSGYLGSLYNAREERFCSGSLFHRRANLTDIPDIKIEYTFDNSYSGRFQKLEINGELKLSILAGLIDLKGSGEYLNDDKTSYRSVYQIRTKREDINIFDDNLRPYISTDAFKIADATHFVGAIEWGANSFASFEYKNSEKAESTKIEGKMASELEKIIGGIKGGIRRRNPKKRRASSNSG